MGEAVLVDDALGDSTAGMAVDLGINTIIHQDNQGYGGIQKRCYHTALKLGVDIVVMAHPDYRYSSRLVVAMASMVT
ncbi:MAG: hypothetical protein ACLPX5_17085 [Dissulfurispiraceae bacterium]